MPSQPFNMLFAPHYGMFKHHAGDDLVDQIKFCHDAGFRAWEDNHLMDREVAVQDKIASALDDLGMTMGVFVAKTFWGEPIYVRGGKEAREKLKQKMREAVEVAKRVNARWCTIVPGPYVQDLEWDYQTANAIDCLRAMAEVCEPAGLVMALEPLNRWANHPEMFLSHIPQAYLICEAVNSPSCKILNDLYHAQIMEGSLMLNIDKTWLRTAYFQIGDSPGRNEPGTGEINYANIFAELDRRGYSGVLGMEHGISIDGKEGERKLIEAYRRCDVIK
ncbi:hydroxypyruvate isomerase family protein [Algisphaera agarilytica]|uniref:Hydroxypyruvate isomerase n=1 Tax=Algisphaera agarilytica TaxID=1385975 RepID=A0A7X0LK06_9BACT|nr:TIM barrel protein [Algisphaera agarilytica]MBB6429136.1 hydroxypyruvate isomerase [Algisphaera agarilytica]